MDLDSLKAEIDKLPTAVDREHAIKLLLAIQERKSLSESRTQFMPFVQRMWPDFIRGDHHKIMADAFDRIANGELKRLIISMPPRHTKSEFASYLFPAYFLGRYPNKKIIQASHTAELSVGFGRKVRNLLNTPEYHEVFPDVTIAADSKAAGRWNTNHGGTYFAVGVGGALAGIGADVLVIDDPISEQDAMAGLANSDVFDKIYDWYVTGPRQRLQPNGAIVQVATRWAKKDLAGQTIKHSIEGEGADTWEVINLPAILPSGNPLWPEFWSLEELEKIKASIPLGNWLAQYQQEPTAEEGALIKRDWWRRWEGKRPPKVEGVIQSWDTAFLKTERSDYSACTTWGVFYHPDDRGLDQPNLILLHAFKDKLEFPDLKKKARELYMTWEPEQCIVEKKSSGAPLLFELRRMGIPVSEFAPHRGQDKIARVNAVTDLFASGFVWAPLTRWADEVIEECASFPVGEHDDFVDSTTQAMLKFRQGGWVALDIDENDEEEYPPVVREYY